MWARVCFPRASSTQWKLEKCLQECPFFVAGCTQQHCVTGPSTKVTRQFAKFSAEQFVYLLADI